MTIQETKIRVRELFDGYQDNKDNGVVAYGGKLDVRPAYQREFVYKPAQQQAVIDTLSKGYPLNIMYWADLGDGRYEIIDGQQRTLSICEYLAGNFSCKIFRPGNFYFHNLTSSEQDQLLDYELTVYLCSGSDAEKLEWFRTINIAGERLTDQELRNAVYSGSWVSDAKRYFSKRGCAAHGLGGAYLLGEAIRQVYLETVIEWYADSESPGKSIELCMAQHQHDPDAKALWDYFQRVIKWVKETFPTYRKEMKGQPWGIYYNRYHGNRYDPQALEQEVATLMADDEVESKKGIYPYVLEKAIGNIETKHLSLRVFSDAQKRGAYERQKGVCACCGKTFAIEEMEGDHITPWAKGGKTTEDNLQMLCRDCNRRKGAK